MKQKTRTPMTRKREKIVDQIKNPAYSSLCFGYGMARISPPLHGGHGNHIVTAGNVSLRAWRIAETRLGSSPVLNYVVSLSSLASPMLSERQSRGGQLPLARLVLPPNALICSIGNKYAFLDLNYLFKSRDCV